MTLGRLWRTVRHLTAEQWIYCFVCRGRRIVMRRFPGISRWWIDRAANRLPLPDVSAPTAAAIGDIVPGALVIDTPDAAFDSTGVIQFDVVASTTPFTEGSALFGVLVAPRHKEGAAVV